jgi:hypothetical protein
MNYEYNNHISITSGVNCTRRDKAVSEVEL